MTTYTPQESVVQPAVKEGTKAERKAKAYMNPYLAGILLGFVLFAAFFVTGSGLGASGGLNRILVFLKIWSFLGTSIVPHTSFLWPVEIKIHWTVGSFF